MDRSQARQRLDDRLASVEPGSLRRPHRGWVRAIRDALGMSTAELATRMGIAQQSVVHLERSEEHETIKLETLRRAAQALDCELVYALVPRTSLDVAVHERARGKARRLLAEVSHHSRLEDQSVDDAAFAAEVDALAEQMIDRRGLWRDETERRGPASPEGGQR